MRAFLILASDRVAAGQRRDATAARVRAVLRAGGWELAGVRAVPDDVDRLEDALRGACGRVQLVLTSGGTGLSPRDVTPEATRRVLEREVPGLPEAMRAVSRGTVPTAILSRALAGTVGCTLVVNLPGSPAGAAQCLAAVLPALRHAVRLLQGAVGDCVPATGGPGPTGTG